jgi:hypothetical protein
MHLLRVSISLGVLLLLTVVPVAASALCDAVVEQALTIVDQACAATGRNEACHGYTRVEAEPRLSDASFSFEQGDIEHLTAIRTLRTVPLDVTTGEWGVAFLRVQANLPDTLPGAASTFLLFGDAELEDAGSDASQRPMQAVRLRTNLTGVSCDDAPLNGLLIQTPEAATERVELTINDIEVSLGSTIFFRAGTDNVLEVTTLEGTAEIRTHGVDLVVLPGETLRIWSRENRVESLKYDVLSLQRLPLSLLDFPINVPPARPPRDVRGLPWSNGGSGGELPWQGGNDARNGGGVGADGGGVGAAGGGVGAAGGDDDDGDDGDE